MLTWILFVIVAAFIAYEAVAHFLWHNVGMETLSRIVLNAEQRWGWPVRVLVAAAVIALGVHLEGAF
jgi:hypothetical protein